MADNYPNDASRKSKAEGDRMTDNGAGNAGERQKPGADEAGGITNRPLDEEQANQEEVPPRGESQPGANAGRGNKDAGRSDA